MKIIMKQRGLHLNLHAAKLLTSDDTVSFKDISMSKLVHDGVVIALAKKEYSAATILRAINGHGLSTVIPMVETSTHYYLYMDVSTIFQVTELHEDNNTGNFLVKKIQEEIMPLLDSSYFDHSEVECETYVRDNRQVVNICTNVIDTSMKLEAMMTHDVDMTPDKATALVPVTVDINASYATLLELESLGIKVTKENIGRYTAADLKFNIDTRMENMFFSIVKRAFDKSIPPEDCSFYELTLDNVTSAAKASYSEAIALGVKPEHAMALLPSTVKLNSMCTATMEIWDKAFTLAENDELAEETTMVLRLLYAVLNMSSSGTVMNKMLGNHMELIKKMR